MSTVAVAPVPSPVGIDRLTGWAKMPCSWQLLPDRHAVLSGNSPGQVIAALKIYLSMCLYANFGPNGRFAAAGCTQRSVTAWCRSLKLSRPVAISGLRLLNATGIAERLGGRPETYRIADYETARYWTRLPKTYLLGSTPRQVEKLASFPSRGRSAANALRLYVYIAAVRDRKTFAATVGYTKIIDTLGLSRNAVSSAISMLVEHELVTVRNNKLAELHMVGYDGPIPRDIYVATNTYFLRGFGRRQQHASET
jgi:hypothetical protein